MSLDKIALIVIIIHVKDVILRTDSISISHGSVSWEEATRSCHTLLSLDYVLKHGWDSIPSYIPGNSSGSRYWIGARANHTPFVSWEGCVQWIGGVECGKILPAGSIGDCLKTCNKDLHHILLKDSHCRCVPRNYSTCFNHTRGRCNRQCPNNPNDWCGGSNDAMSLYYTGPHTYIINDTNNVIERNCAVLIDRKRTHTANPLQFQPYSCSATLIRRYICKNETSAVLEDNTVPLEWLKAYELCRENNLRLHYNVSHKMNGSVYWTSLRRSILLEWPNNEDEHFPFCVSISVDNFTINLHEEPCDRAYRYLYLSGNKEGYFLWRRWYPLLAVPIAGLLLIAIIFRVFLMGKRIKESKHLECLEQERQTVACEHVNNTVEERPSASAPRHMYHILEIVDRDGKKVSSHEARNNNQTSIANTELDNRNRGGVPKLISNPGSVYNTTIGPGNVRTVDNSNNVYNTTHYRGYDASVNSRYRGGLPKLTSDPGSAYNTIGPSAIEIGQNSKNVYNTTNCRGIATSMPSDYVSCNVYNSVRNMDIDVYDNAETLPEMAVVDDTNTYDHVK